ncbi:MAG TPA: hypothetical protein VI874_02375, partial [Candidatus Norongarragalinales archaeon]|nr:hypothetical protein [Candidatus Norongarragalinales archaeon]
FLALVIFSALLCADPTSVTLKVDRHVDGFSIKVSKEPGRQLVDLGPQNELRAYLVGIPSRPKKSGGTYVQKDLPSARIAQSALKVQFHSKSDILGSKSYTAYFTGKQYSTAVSELMKKNRGSKFNLKKSAFAVFVELYRSNNKIATLYDPLYLHDYAVLDPLPLSLFPTNKPDPRRLSQGPPIRKDVSFNFRIFPDSGKGSFQVKLFPDRSGDIRFKIREKISSIQLFLVGLTPVPSPQDLAQTFPDVRAGQIGIRDEPMAIKDGVVPKVAPFDRIKAEEPYEFYLLDTQSGLDFPSQTKPYSFTLTPDALSEAAKSMVASSSIRFPKPKDSQFLLKSNHIALTIMAVFYEKLAIDKPLPVGSVIYADYLPSAMVASSLEKTPNPLFEPTDQVLAKIDSGNVHVSFKTNAISVREGKRFQANTVDYFFAGFHERILPLASRGILREEKHLKLFELPNAPEKLVLVENDGETRLGQAKPGQPRQAGFVIQPGHRIRNVAWSELENRVELDYSLRTIQEAVRHYLFSARDPSKVRFAFFAVKRSEKILDPFDKAGSPETIQADFVVLSSFYSAEDFGLGNARNPPSKKRPVALQRVPNRPFPS